MFTVDTALDAIQTAQKEAVKTFVKHEAIAKSLNELVDVQSKFARDAVKTGTDVATKVGTELTKVGQEIAKFDYAKQITEAAETLGKTFAKK